MAANGEEPIGSMGTTGRWSACVPLQGSDEYAGAPACTSLKLAADGLAGFYDAVAGEVSRPGPGEPSEIPAPVMVAAAVPRQPVAVGVTEGDHGASVLSPTQELPHPHLLWVQEHLHHLSKSAQTVRERPCTWRRSAAGPGGGSRAGGRPGDRAPHKVGYVG